MKICTPRRNQCRLHLPTNKLNKPFKASEFAKKWSPSHYVEVMITILQYEESVASLSRRTLVRILYLQCNYKKNEEPSPLAYSSICFFDTFSSSLYSLIFFSLYKCFMKKWRRTQMKEIQMNVLKIIKSSKYLVRVPWISTLHRISESYQNTLKLCRTSINK